MTWKRTLPIGAKGVTVEVLDEPVGHVEVGITVGDRLTPLEAVEVADVLKRAARFAERQMDLNLASTGRRAG